MESVSHTLYRRGKRGTSYLRRRIPQQLRDAYPPHKREITCGLRTCGHVLVVQRLHAQTTKVNQEFERKRGQLARRRIFSARAATQGAHSPSR